MTNAKRDSNHVTASLGVQLDDLTTTTPIVIDQTNGRLLTSTIVTAVNGGSLVNEEYDSIAATYPDTSTEVYTYKLGATTVATVTIVFSDAVTKQILTSVTRT